MRFLYGLLVALILISAIACNDPKAAFHSPVKNTVSEAKTTNIGRSSWQKPQLVIEKLGDISGKTIADIGAGTGYFTFRMAFNAKKIIATDIDTNMIAIINEFAVNLPQEIQARIETRLVKADDPMIGKGEADIIVMINTLAYIHDQQDYLQKLHNIMKPGDTLFIVDFKSSVNSGIAKNSKTIDAVKVEEYLRSSGYSNVEIDNQTLEYQYIIQAKA